MFRQIREVSFLAFEQYSLKTTESLMYSFCGHVFAIHRDIVGSAVSLSNTTLTPPIGTDIIEGLTVMQIIILRIPHVVGTFVFFYATL